MEEDVNQTVTNMMNDLIPLLPPGYTGTLWDFNTELKNKFTTLYWAVVESKRRRGHQNVTQILHTGHVSNIGDFIEGSQPKRWRVKTT